MTNLIESACETCRWWLTGDQLRDRCKGDAYLHHKPRPRFGVCELTVMSSAEREANGGERFVTEDASDYYSHLSTRDDFGCVSHEAKQ